VLALGAFQWGPAAIRLANGLPRANVPQLADEVQKYVPDYEKDGRLTTRTKPPTNPSASASPSVSASPSPTPSKSGANSAPPAPASPKPAKQLYDPGKIYQIENSWAGAIIDVPGDNDAGVSSGTRVNLWNSQRAQDQFWKITKKADSGYVTITNDFNGMNLAVENDSKDNGSKLVVVTRNDHDRSQQWKLEDAGSGQVWITNRGSGKAMDLLGDDNGPPNSDGTWNSYLVEQWDKQTYAHDQRWLLVSS
jgi:hypothetical protein